MSRHTKKLPSGYTVAYGSDNALGGYWINVSFVDTETKEDVIVLEESVLFTKLNRTTMLSIMLKYGIKNNNHLRFVALGELIP